MNVVFLDYDGVVNTPMWSDDGKHCSYGMPSGNKVNNFQCVQWVSEFCQKYGYSIVVTSTWRMDTNYIECLKNGGLRDGIEVIGKTPILNDKSRGEEIKAFLSAHPEVDKFIIFDDESDMNDLKDHLILCNTATGFGMNEYEKASKFVSNIT